MNYIVRVWREHCETAYHEFMDREDAVGFADQEAKRFREAGCEFDVMIYEITRY